jgi:pimeloyl-ACP methyl ester carboxylesterase
VAAVLQGLDIVLPGQSFRVVSFSAGLMFAADVAARLGGRVTQLVAGGAGAVGPITPLPMRSLRGITDPDEIAATHRYNLGVLMIADPDKVDDLALFIHQENVGRLRFVFQRMDEGAPALVRLRSVQSPIAVIWAGKDAARPDAEHYRKMFNTLQPGLPFHVVDGAGHWVMYEASAEFNATLRRFLAGKAA